MAKTLNEIQTSVRVLARDGGLTLTSGDGLVSANRIYRQLALALPWSELRRQDSSLTTTSGTGTYTWPTDVSDPVFLDVLALEIQDQEDNDYYKLVYPPPDEWTWSLSENKPSQNLPDHYIRSSTALVQQLEFRPTPLHSSKTIRITGIIEPIELSGTYSETVFINKTADDALENLIASAWVERDGDPQWAGRLIEKAASLLKQLFDADSVTLELLRRVVQD